MGSSSRAKNEARLAKFDRTNCLSCEFCAKLCFTLVDEVEDALAFVLDLEVLLIDFIPCTPRDISRRKNAWVYDTCPNHQHIAHDL